MVRNKTHVYVSLAIVMGILTFVLAACGASLSGSSAASDASASDDAQGASAADNVVTVAASPALQARILNEAVAPLLEAEGYTLEVREYDDYVEPNTATEEGEVDANFFQHAPYLADFNAEHGTHLVSVADVFLAPMRIYAGQTSTLGELKQGASVAVPNDVTNEARALLLLQAAGLISLSDPDDTRATPDDIVDNPLGIVLREVEAAKVPDVRAEVDIALINTNYALEAEIPKADVLFIEATDSPYVNVVAVKEGNEDDPGIRALVRVITSAEVADYIDATFDGAVLATN